MREKERETPRERNQGEWFVVKRRRRQTGGMSNSTACKTIFIDFLPLEINLQTLRFIFNPYGTILSIVIPDKIRVNCKYRYAFIKFLSTHSLLGAIGHANGRKIGNYKLKVSPAKYDTSTQANQTPPLRQGPPYKPNPLINNHYAANRDHRSYKEVASPSTFKPHTVYPNPSLTNLKQMNHPEFSNPDPTIPIPNHPQKIQPHQDLEPPAEPFNREMSKLRIMHSRVLGENTEKVRDETVLAEMEGEQIISIQGKRDGANDELFSRSVIAVAHSSSSSEIIHGHILAEGVNCLKISPLGGLLHLITFETMEDKEAIVESQWLLNWFMEIRQVNKSSKAIWRQSTIVIYGVPLSAWNYDNFFNIGSIYGRVLSVDYARLDYATVKIITDCFFLINNPIILDLEGGKFKIFVNEENTKETDHQNYKVNNGSPKRDDQKDGHVVSSQEDDDDEDDEDDEMQIIESPTARPFPCLEEELKKTAVDLGDDDNKCLFKGSLGTPEKIIQVPIIPLKLQSPHIPSSEQQLANGPDPSGLSPLLKESLTSLENIQLLSPPSKTFIPSKLNLEMDSNPNLNFSPQKSHKSLSPNLSRHNQTILLPNTLSLMLSKPTSKTLSSSPSVSGPSIPPGFEDFIPSPLKIQHEKKRLKKIHKKREKRKRATSLKPANSTPIPSSTLLIQKESFDSTAAEIIELGIKMGMNFQGPLSELHSKIRNILIRQKQDWTSIQ